MRWISLRGLSTSVTVVMKRSVNGPNWTLHWTISIERLEFGEHCPSIAAAARHDSMGASGSVSLSISEA